MENQTTENFTDEDVSKIIQGLSEDDLKKILFLVIDSKDLHNYESLIVQNEKMKQKLQHIYGKHDLSLIIETLFTIKKYSFLKRFNQCKHQRNFNTQGNITKFRKFLFSVCEELIDDDVSYLGKELLKHEENYHISAECLMCRLLVQKIISSKNLTKLKAVFEKAPTHYDNLLRKFDSVILEASSDEPVSSSGSSSSDSEDELMVYPVEFSTKNKKCGIAVILNQVKFRNFQMRKGSNVDRDKLITIWEKFGFEVINYENLEADKIMTVFQELARRKYEDPSVFVACLLSHGDGGDVIFGSDGKSVIVHNLVDLIANECRSLYKMPKLFFVQACKGKKVQEALVCDSPNASSYDLDDRTVDVQRYIPRMCDTFVAYATVEGFASLRSKEKGSIFIQELTKYLEKFGEIEDIDVIMKRVTNSIAAMEPKIKQSPGAQTNTELKLSKQMPEYRSTLRGILKFKKL